jgi:hypothetical protein
VEIRINRELQEKDERGRALRTIRAWIDVVE